MMLNPRRAGLLWPALALFGLYAWFQGELIIRTTGRCTLTKQ